MGNRTNKRKIHHTRLLFYFLLLILAFLLQTSVFPLLPFLFASPNLLLILCFSFGFYYGPLPGMLYGLSAGLLMDLFYSGPFGFYSFIFVLIGYVNGYFHEFYYEEFIQLPLFLCVLSGILYHGYIYVLRFLIRGKWSILYYSFHIVLPSIVFSFLLTLLLYRFFFSASKKLEENVL